MTEKKARAEIRKLDPVLTIARAAEVAGVSRRTIRYWIKAKDLKSSRPDWQAGSSRVLVDTRSLLGLLGVEVRE